MVPMGEAAETRDEFVELLNAVVPCAFSIAKRLARNDADAEDLLQEASLRAFSNFHTFQKDTNFKAWFLRILTNCFNMRWRKKKREPVIADLDQAPALYMFRQAFVEGLLSTSDDPAMDILSRLDSERVTEAIRQIPEEHRVVCTLYFLEELAYQEISEVLDIPVGTVRSRLHRGRRMLQKTLWQFAKDDGIISGLQSESRS